MTAPTTKRDGALMTNEKVTRLIATLREWGGKNTIHPHAGTWMIDAADALTLLSEREPAVAQGWRCFHCEATFTDAESAREHFGNSERQGPICEIDAARFRETEAMLARYREDDTDLHREIYGMQARHGVELRREEEKGYARGLADGISLGVDGWKIAPHGDGWVIAEPEGRSHIAHDKPMCDETERVLARLCSALSARTANDAEHGWIHQSMLLREITPGADPSEYVRVNLAGRCAAASSVTDQEVTANGKPASQFFRAGRRQGVEEAIRACDAVDVVGAEECVAAVRALLGDQEMPS
jgi:hypothetical protein